MMTRGMERSAVWALAAVAVAVWALAVSAEAQVRPEQENEASGRVFRFEVTIGKSQVIDLKEPFARVSVTNPAIADVFVVTPNQILINGKSAGVTSLVVFYPNRTIYFDLIVQTDVALLKERLKTLAPRSEIEVQAAKDTIILNGSVSSEDLIEKAGEVAEIFAPKKVVNLLKATDLKSQQVLLQVHVAEVSRTALNQLGFSARLLGSSFQGGAWPGSPILGLTPFGTLGDSASPNFLFSDLATFFLGSPSRNYAGIVKVLTERDLLRTLAKPNLITVSGKEAKFLSGGEFPYPVPQGGATGATTITIEFKQFGVQLVFTPLVREDGTISLKVAPEVSSLDFSQGLTIQGFNVPALLSNRAAATLELKDGETFAMAGLINNTVRRQIAKIPVLGDIPVLGALFRSTSFRNDESELVFLVTTHLVKPFAPGEGPDVNRLFELRESERNPYTGINTLVPGIPDVGGEIEKPFGQSNLPSGK